MKDKQTCNSGRQVHGSMVSFIYNPEAKRRGHLLSSYENFNKTYYHRSMYI